MRSATSTKPASDGSVRSASAPALRAGSAESAAQGSAAEAVSRPSGHPAPSRAGSPVGPTRRAALGSLARAAGLVSAAGLLPLLGGSATAAVPLTAVVSHQRTGEVFAEVPAALGEEWSLFWIHSVDHTPWEEYYRLTRDGWVLDCTEVGSFGAGTPYDAPEVRETPDGRTILCGIDLTLPSIRWINSHDVGYRLSGPRLTMTGDQLPHREPVELRILRKA